MKFHRVLLQIALLSVTFCAVAWGQDTGSITGTVKDPSGAAVAGATVEVSSSDHGIVRQTVTNSSGDYNESGLPGGVYDVSVKATRVQKVPGQGRETGRRGKSPCRYSAAGRRRRHGSCRGRRERGRSRDSVFGACRHCDRKGNLPARTERPELHAVGHPDSRASATRPVRTKARSASTAMSATA